MRIFQVLCRRKHMPNGHIYRGKNRIVRPPSMQDLVQVKTQLEIEEKNMFYLRHPYITIEQSAGHARALGKNEANYIKTKTKVKPFFDNVTIESRLAHLRVTESWD